MQQKKNIIFCKTMKKNKSPTQTNLGLTKQNQYQMQYSKNEKLVNPYGSISTFQSNGSQIFFLNDRKKLNMFDEKQQFMKDSLYLHPYNRESDLIPETSNICEEEKEQNIFVSSKMKESKNLCNEKSQKQQSNLFGNTSSQKNSNISTETPKFKQSKNNVFSKEGKTKNQKYQNHQLSSYPANNNSENKASSTNIDDDDDDDDDVVDEQNFDNLKQQLCYGSKAMNEQWKPLSSSVRLCNLSQNKNKDYIDQIKKKTFYQSMAHQNCNHGNANQKFSEITKQQISNMLKNRQIQNASQTRIFVDKSKFIIQTNKLSSNPQNKAENVQDVEKQHKINEKKMHLLENAYQHMNNRINKMQQNIDKMEKNKNEQQNNLYQPRKLKSKLGQKPKKNTKNLQKMQQQIIGISIEIDKFLVQIDLKQLTKQNKFDRVKEIKTQIQHLLSQISQIFKDSSQDSIKSLTQNSWNFSTKLVKMSNILNFIEEVHTRYSKSQSKLKTLKNQAQDFQKFDKLKQIELMQKLKVSIDQLKESKFYGTEVLEIMIIKIYNNFIEEQVGLLQNFFQCLKTDIFDNR